jgi:hypothetical protein
MSSNKILNFVEFHCILLTFALAFNDLKSLLQNFGLDQTGSKFRDLRLDDGKS